MADIKCYIIEVQARGYLCFTESANYSKNFIFAFSYNQWCSGKLKSAFYAEDIGGIQRLQVRYVPKCNVPNESEKERFGMGL